jgi:hypothetical protein
VGYKYRLASDTLLLICKRSLSVLSQSDLNKVDWQDCCSGEAGIALAAHTLTCTSWSWSLLHNRNSVFTWVKSYCYKSDYAYQVCRLKIMTSHNAEWHYKEQGWPQPHICVVYVRYNWQENHQYTVIYNVYIWFSQTLTISRTRVAYFF